MVVESPLALFTTLFGWQFYNAIWFTLLSTGIALLPFLGALIEALFSDREDGQFVGSDPVGIYKRVEAKILLMLVVVALAAQPSSLTSITPDTITFTAEPTLVNQTPAEITAANPGNTFGDTDFAAFDELDQAGVRLPIWWYAVLQASAGINAAVIAGFPDIDSLRDITRLAQFAQISDPVVRSEVSAFFTDCYLPAKTRFERENPEGAESVDLSFIGSRFFLEEFRIRNGEGPLIYDKLRSEDVVDGFPFDPNRDTEWTPELAPDSGKPTCSQWWLGDGRTGLRELLLAQVDISEVGLADRIVGGINVLVPDGFEIEFLEDRLIQDVLTRNPPSITNTSFGESAFEPGDGLIDAGLRNIVQPFFTAAGVLGASAFFALFMEVITQVLPMVQPMILMGIFAVLPFAMVVSRYSLSFLAIGAIGIFTINFWPVLWHIATWVDDNLTLALFPAINAGGDSGSAFLELIFSGRGFSGASEPKIILLNMVTASLFLILPGLFTVVMTWAGYRAGSSMSALTSSATNNPAASAAASGPGKAASGVVSIGRLAAGKKLAGKK
ncbi:MAG: conjugal transfer protein TraG N-terminal domain-containing protein [Geminicoccales bacterium]